MSIFLYHMKQAQPEYPHGGTDAEWMQRIAVRLCGLMSADCSAYMIKKSIRACYRFREKAPHLHIVLKTACGHPPGQSKGASIRYSPAACYAANQIALAYSKVYPEPKRITVHQTAHSVRRVAQPTRYMVISLGYRDNPQDEIWITSSVDRIAQAFASGLDAAIKAPHESGI